MITRRLFAGWLGAGSALAGVVSPRDVGMLDAAPPVRLYDDGLDGLMAEECSAPSPIEWATKELAEVVDPRRRERRYRETSVDYFDPDVASLRSLSLSGRMAIQKRRLFAQREAKRTDYLTGVIKGWWS